MLPTAKKRNSKKKGGGRPKDRDREA